MESSKEKTTVKVQRETIEVHAKIIEDLVEKTKIMNDRILGLERLVSELKNLSPQAIYNIDIGTHHPPHFGH